MSKKENQNEDFVEYIENLNEEVKSLALNLAIYLAKAKSSSQQLSHMEPDFIRLVNGTVKVVQDVTLIINAAKSKETLVYDVPSGNMRSDHLENKLNSILDQCRQILNELAVHQEKTPQDEV